MGFECVEEVEHIHTAPLAGFLHLPVGYGSKQSMVAFLHALDALLEVLWAPCSLSTAFALEVAREADL